MIYFKFLYKSAQQLLLHHVLLLHKITAYVYFYNTHTGKKNLRVQTGKPYCTVKMF